MDEFEKFDEFCRDCEAQIQKLIQYHEIEWYEFDWDLEEDENEITFNEL